MKLLLQVSDVGDFDSDTRYAIRYAIVEVNDEMKRHLSPSSLPLTWQT